MSHDPKLKEAMTEIEALCDKYDIGAFVALVSKSHAEYRYHLPTWTGLSWEKGADGKLLGIRVRLKGPAIDQATKELADLTGHFIFSVRDIAAVTFDYMRRFTEELQKNALVSHKPFADFEPHQGD